MVDPGPISIILLSPVYFTRTVYFTRIPLLFSTWYTHNLCYKQTGEIDNLIARWEQSICLCVCRFRVAASKQSLDEAPYINCPELSQTSPHHLQSSLCAFLLNDKPWFLNSGKTSCYTHHTFLLGFPTGWSFTTHKDVWSPTSTRRISLFSSAVAGEEWKTSARGVSARTSFTLLLFCFTLFILPALFYIKNPKKLRILGS
jgi:hypothetical protein